MGAQSTVPGFTNARLFLVLGALATATMLAALETSIIATALPTITGEFGAFESFAWVGTAYIVTSAVSTPILGKLSDIYGRRTIFQTTMAVFLVGSLLCGAAQTMGQLIAARAFQGMGGGGIQALAFAVMGDILPPRERGRYIGYFTLAFIGAALLGPVVGGYIIDNYSWPWIFWINVPAILVVGTVTHIALRLPFTKRDARIDFTGAALLSVSIGSLMVALEEGRHGWTQRHVVVLLAVGVSALFVFVRVEHTASEPMIPLHLFKNPVVLACSLLGLAAGVISFGAGQFLNLYFQDSQFISPTESGLRTIPQMMGVTAATFGVGRLIARTGRYKRYPVIGSSLAVVGLLVVSQITGTTPYWVLIVPMVFMGFGSASIFTSTSIAGQNAVEFRDMGVTTAFMLFSRNFGGAFGLAIFGTILNGTIRSEIPARTGIAADEASSLIRVPSEIALLPEVQRNAVVDSVALGVGRIYLVCAIVMALAVVVAILLPERPLRLRAGLSDAMEENSAQS
ncbi:MAG: MDR family MFS transporter [Ilumatobacteraceae bacterium]